MYAGPSLFTFCRYRGWGRTQFKHLSIPLLISIFHSALRKGAPAPLHLIFIRRGSVVEQTKQEMPKAIPFRNVLSPLESIHLYIYSMEYDKHLPPAPNPVCFILSPSPAWHLGNLMTRCAIPKLLSKLNIFLFLVCLFPFFSLIFFSRFLPCSMLYASQK